jgi:hypothetical protein
MPSVWTDYIAATAMFNAQILPESLMCGIIILAVLLGNKSIFAVAAGAGLTQLLAMGVGRIVMKFKPESAMIRSSMDTCTSGYVGQSWDRLLRGSATPDLLWHPLSPSVYLATIGFFSGWGFGLQQIYKEEIDAGVVDSGLMTSMTVVTLLLLTLALVFRTYSGCETVVGAIGGAAFGLLLGYLLCVALGFSTDRRATNIWGIPLLRDRINDGAAVYICPNAK